MLVDGKNVPDLDADGLALLRREIAFVFQFAALFDSMTVREHPAAGFRKQGMSATTSESRVAESLAVVEPGRHGRPYPPSVGRHAKAAWDRSRSGAEAALHLYDEPTNQLDPVTSAVIDDLMVRTRDLGATGLIVTHDLRTSFSVGDRIAMHR